MGFHHPFCQAVALQMETYPSYATAMNTVRLVEYSEIEKNASLKKWKREYDGKSSGYSGSAGGSKPPIQGQFTLVSPSALVLSSTGAPRHRSETKGGQSTVQFGSSHFGHDKSRCFRCKKPFRGISLWRPYMLPMRPGTPF